MLADTLRRVKRGVGMVSAIVGTSTFSAATAHGNQRKLDRCQNGVLWCVKNLGFNAIGGNTAVYQLAYSLNNGQTWANDPTYVQTAVGSTGTHYTSSLFIDLDDYAHLVYIAPNKDLYYRRGTPNAGRTAWTWSAPYGVYIASGLPSDMEYFDMVAHRNPSTGGWTVHVVMSSGGNADAWSIYGQQINISSGGVFTTPVTGTEGAIFNLGSNQGGSANKFAMPSIDFHHTGDGKTVKSSLPHVFISWSTNGTSISGIRFVKRTYLAGTWTSGTERDISAGVGYSYDNSYLANCMWDGTRVIIGGFLRTGANSEIRIWNRDLADTTTTLMGSVLAIPAGSSLYWGSATYDEDGNVYIFGTEADATGGFTVGYRKWIRSTGLFGPWTLVGGVVGLWSSAKRGYSGDRIEMVYTDGTVSPFNVVFKGMAA